MQDFTFSMIIVLTLFLSITNQPMPPSPNVVQRQVMINIKKDDSIDDVTTYIIPTAINIINKHRTNTDVKNVMTE